MNTYFTSDSHFGHTNIIKYCNRPFASAEEMDNVLIDNINKLVQPNDILYHLGDFCLGKRHDPIGSTIAYLKRINCKNIILITGNHDPIYSNGQAKPDFSSLFSENYNHIEVKINGQRITLNHYAMKVWNKSHHGAWHLYGHSHYSLPDDPNALSIDVGVDAVAGRATGYQRYELESYRMTNLLKPEDYRPISFEEIQEIMSKKTFKPIDHHDRSTKD